MISLFGFRDKKTPRREFRLDSFDPIKFIGDLPCFDLIECFIDLLREVAIRRSRQCIVLIT